MTWARDSAPGFATQRRPVKRERGGAKDPVQTTAELPAFSFLLPKMSGKDVSLGLNIP